MGAFDARLGSKSATEPTLDRFIAAFDLGCGKTACLIGAGANSSVLAGAGWVGVRRGPDGAPADDFTAAANAARAALDQAERIAGGQAIAALAAYGGPGLKSRRFKARHTFSPRPIATREVSACVRAALALAPVENERHLHVLPLSYQVDDGAPVLDPRWVNGSSLSVDLCLISAPEDSIAALCACLEEAGVSVQAVAAAPYAAGMGVLTELERQTGAIVLDWGAGSAGIGAFMGGELCFAATVSAGSAGVTRAMAQALNTSFAAADRIKIQHGRAISTGPGAGILEIPVLNADGRLELGAVLRATLEGVSAAACARMMQRVAPLIAQAEAATGAFGLPVIVTGGGAQIEGFVDLARATFARPCRLGLPATIAESGSAAGAPALAVAAGLIQWAANRPSEAAFAAEASGLNAIPSQLRARIRSALSWLWDNF
jgi:cell division protein FtsA